MKLIHVIVSLEVGGAEGMLQRLVKEASKNPLLNQAIITLKGEGEIGRQLRMQGYEVISLNMTMKLSAPFTLFKLIQIFKHRRPDAVYTWMYHSDLLGGVAAFLSGVKKIIWGIRNTQIPQKSLSITGVIIRICSLLSYFVPTKIVCCAESAKSAHLKLGFCSSKMIVIPNGYDLSSFKPSLELRHLVRKNLGLLESTLVVGVVGRFDPLKDFNNFVQACGLVSRNLSNVKFLMIGKGLDKDNDELDTWIKKTNHPDNFILIGKASPHDLYAAMDIFCLSSKSEGFPNVVAEAMAMQIPCVVTDAGDAARIVGKLGIIVEPMDAYALFKGLMLMLTMEKQTRQVLGNKGRQLIENQYAISKVHKQYLALINAPKMEMKNE